MTPARAGVCISLIEQTPKHRILSSGYLLSVTPLYRCKKQESKGLKPAADGGGGFRKQAVSVAISLALAARAPAPATPGEAGAIGCNPAAASRNNSSTRRARSGAWFGCRGPRARSAAHTSELQHHCTLVC